MPRLRIPTDVYERAKTLAGREGTAFRAWAKARAIKYNGVSVSCETTRSASVVVQVDVDLPADTVRSAIMAALKGVSVIHGERSQSVIEAQIYVESFWGRECDRERAIELLDARLKERVSELEHAKEKTHRKVVANV